VRGIEWAFRFESRSQTYSFGTPGSGSTWNGALFSYDAMGRVINLWQCGPATCGTANQAARPLSFTYDWAGNLTGESDTVSGMIAYTRSTAGEVMSITNQTYQNLPQNPPNLVSNVVNGPDGPVSYTLGNGLNVYQGYDTLGRLTGRWVCSGPATMYCSGGSQVYGTGGPWRGTRMLSQSDTVLNQQVTFGYDEFNRLNARTVTQGTLQNYTYSYDRYGNRVSQTPLQGGYTFNPTINPVNNQITNSGYTYDPAGNMLNDTAHSYSYDAEGNLVQVDGGSTAQYVYDVFNRRIQVQTSSATTEYIYDYAGRRVSSWASPNTGNEGRIYWDGQLIAHRSLEALTYFDHEDTLGTQRIRTNYAGYVASSYLSLPWGDGYSATVNNFGGDQDNLHFAGLEHDAESDTEHAQFRNYASAQGRWLGPDSYLGSYDLTNPQSMNRYAYALNNPTSLLDPSGLETTQPVFCGTDASGDPVYCMETVNNPSNGPCAAQGTEGCIPWPCWMVWGCGSGSQPSGTQSTGGGGGGTPQSKGPPHTATVSDSCASRRVVSAVTGALNIGVAAYKASELGGVVAAAGATGAGAPAAAVAGIYGTLSIVGQVVTGAAQVYSAATGNYGVTATQAEQFGTIIGGPLAGIGTLLTGGSTANAARNAGIESSILAGSAAVSALAQEALGTSANLADAWLGVFPGLTCAN
jgi:RHS repeat-associated protein